MDGENFAETHYGYMHKILLHSIVIMRENYPTTRKLIRKYDFKSAYQQQHLSEKIRNPVGHLDQQERNILHPHLTKTHFWWSERTSLMEHNCRTNYRPHKHTTLGQHLGTTINPIPKPRLNTSAINSVQIHPVHR